MATISLPIPDDLHAALRVAAAEDLRSVTAEILWMLGQAIDERQPKPGTRR